MERPKHLRPVTGHIAPSEPPPEPTGFDAVRLVEAALFKARFGEPLTETEFRQAREALVLLREREYLLETIRRAVS